MIAKIYKIQFLRVKVTRFYFARHGFPARENMSDIFQNTGHIFQNMCLVFLSAPGARQHAGKKYLFHGMEKPPYLPRVLRPGFRRPRRRAARPATKKECPAAGEISCGGALDVVFYSQERRQWSVIMGSNAKLLTFSSPGSPSTYQLTCMLRNTESTAEGSSVREGCHFVQNSGRPKR